MKKTKIVSLLMLVAMLTVMLAACGKSGSKPEDAVIGQWAPTTISFMGETISVDEYLELMDTEETSVLKFEADGKVVVTELGESMEGTYEIKDKTVSVTIEGQSMDLTLEDGKLTMTEETLDMSIVYEKK